MHVFVREITISDYLVNFELPLPVLGIYSVKYAFKGKGVLLGAYIDEGSSEKLSGIVTLDLSPRTSITYIFVQEALRGRGIGTTLLEKALDYAESKGMGRLEARVVMQNDFGEVMDHMLKKSGFEVYTTATILHSANNDKCKTAWAAFKNKRGSHICEGLAKRGYRTLSFDEASEEVFIRLKAAMMYDFPKNLDPFHFISHRDHKVVKDYSFIALKDDMPAAFVTVTTLDNKTLVFQQLSTAYRNQGSGAFLLPFAAFMQRFLEGAAYSKVSAVIYDNNGKMKKLVGSFIGDMVESMKTQYEYIHTLRGENIG